MAENLRRMNRLYGDLVSEVSDGVADGQVAIVAALQRLIPKASGAASKSTRVDIGALDVLSPVVSIDAALANDPVVLAEQALSGYSVFDGDIYIKNRRSYIVPLEEGQSRQAPDGFVIQAIEEGLENAD